MDEKKFEEGIDFFAQLFGSFLELRNNERKFCAKL